MPDWSAGRFDLDVHPPPWNYNPSSWRRRTAIALLASVACVVATYMALYQWRLIGGVWDPVFGAQSRQVLDSNVSRRMHRLMRIPDAALGAFAYLGDAVLGIAGSTRRWQHRPWLILLFGLDVILVSIVSAVLVLLQGTIVGAWCFLCLVTAAISIALVFLAWNEVWSCLLYLRRVKMHSGSWRVVLATIFATPSAAAAEAALSTSEAA